VSVLLLFVLALALVVGAILLLRVHAFLALLGAALLVTLLAPADAVERAARSRGLSEEQAAAFARTPAGERVAEGFGRTAAQIGLLIAMASIIGSALMESGGADRIVRSALRALGQRRAPVAFLGSGFVLSIPVFFDTVFYMLIPLAKAARIRSGGQYLLYVLAIVAGGTMTHSLVPPTPGPLFVANALGVSLALMIAGGCAVGGCAAAVGFAYARWVDARARIPRPRPRTGRGRARAGRAGGRPRAATPVAGRAADRPAHRADRGAGDPRGRRRLERPVRLAAHARREERGRRRRRGESACSCCGACCRPLAWSRPRRAPSAPPASSSS
jgi:H+/gluconate symporter-like permease